MVGENLDVAKKIISSQGYRDSVEELKKALGITVMANYEDVFARLDAAAITRSGLDGNEIESLISQCSSELKVYSVKKHRALNGLPDEQEYPVGEEPSDEDKDSNIVSKSYAPGFLLANAIEFLLARKGVELLRKYLKKSRIPKVNAYSNQVMKFCESVG
ncbi:hypothetical protein [Pseudomonas sp. 18173]|uniref:hypothetical protein n=1 Tax=Pseudomonas sp. 18173 TaxID=3390055 RepID=UPI003D1DCC16